MWTKKPPRTCAFSSGAPTGRCAKITGTVRSPGMRVTMSRWVLRLGTLATCLGALLALAPSPALAQCAVRHRSLPHRSRRDRCDHRAPPGRSAETRWSSQWSTAAATSSASSARPARAGPGRRQLRCPRGRQRLRGRSGPDGRVLLQRPGAPVLADRAFHQRHPLPARRTQQAAGRALRHREHQSRLRLRLRHPERPARRQSGRRTVRERQHGRLRDWDQHRQGEPLRQ